MEALKKCPFCGGNKIYVHGEYNVSMRMEFVFVQCSYCNAQTGLHGIFDGDLETAIRSAKKAWNRRVES